MLARLRRVLWIAAIVLLIAYLLLPTVYFYITGKGSE